MEYYMSEAQRDFLRRRKKAIRRLIICIVTFFACAGYMGLATKLLPLCNARWHEIVLSSSIVSILCTISVVLIPIFSGTVTVYNVNYRSVMADSAHFYENVPRKKLDPMPKTWRQGKCELCGKVTLIAKARLLEDNVLRNANICSACSQNDKSFYYFVNDK